uniref:7TM GPCR serpentine receptor class x (Srx) domain-containing protein n=1 Tax=Strongyloides venezuelensis TaxID=75913 RepID=A0A0K0F1P7_STRVS
MILQITLALFSILSILSGFYMFLLECMKSKLHINVRIGWGNLGLSYLAISTGTLIMSVNELITRNHTTSTVYLVGYIIKTYGSRVNIFAFVAIGLERIISTFFFKYYTNNLFKHFGWIFSLLSNIIGLLWFLSTQLKIMSTRLKNDLHLFILIPTFILFILIFFLNYKFRKRFLEAKLREKYQITQNKEISLKTLPLITIALFIQLVGNVITRAIMITVFKNIYSAYEVESIYYTVCLKN